MKDSKVIIGYRHEYADRPAELEELASFYIEQDVDFYKMFTEPVDFPVYVDNEVGYTITDGYGDDLRYCSPESIVRWADNAKYYSNHWFTMRNEAMIAALKVYLRRWACNLDKQIVVVMYEYKPEYKAD